jgi:hypothetical protein
VKIDASLAVSGAAAKGYEITGVEIHPGDTMTVAAPADVLAAIDTLTVGSIDISGATSDVSVERTVELPPEAYAAAGSGNITVIVRIGLKMTTYTLNDLPIGITGLDPALKVDKAFTGSVTFKCPELSVPGLKAALMHLTADAAGMKAGQQTLTVAAVYDDPEAGVENIVVDPAGIVVTLISATP